MISIKLVAIDVDGTLVNSEKKLTATVKAAINAAKQKQIKIVICTGRPYSGVESLLEELGLQEQAEQYVICFGGALVQSTNGQIIQLRRLAAESYLKLEALTQTLQLHFQAVTSDRIYTSNRNISRYTVYESLITKQELAYRTPNEVANEDLIKAMIVDEQPKIEALIQSDSAFLALRNGINFCQSSPNYIEINAFGVNKGSALEVLCQYLKLTPIEVMAIGDQGNDLSMFKYAGLSVAMGNATSAAKKAALIETDDNDHDGVATAIKRFCLEDMVNLSD
ncbi:Cof-type HAD-IIB family hydrolase [Ligilactobacillus ubinensis]|uniref:Cof-type HAD-IIB family hydrolase n=1 Tax=Ligilactobacillus ubinensis TaxID=2876789 RepID=UPI0020A216FE|nr:Cof-type HAD-IIB family hydrolase [Ligilactobacillus ubinensis]